jgi:hypothetical protein
MGFQRDIAVRWLGPHRVEPSLLLNEAHME